MGFSLVISNGTVVDGTGGEPFVADVGVRDGSIVAVTPGGELADADADEVIDATGLLVTPGFVDIHTHYDGQVTWDPMLTPSCWHGVTTAVMGNCGVGFAPVADADREWLIGLMEGVEDIPGAALSAGIRWGWQSFPQYLDALDRLPLAIDVGTHVPHGAVRAYVMGERGARNEAASAEDIALMAKLVREGVEAGALGFSTSRTIVHRAIDGEPVPGTFAAEDELFGIGQALAAAGTGVFELAPAGIMGEDLAAPDRELDWMLRLAELTGRTVCFGLMQHDNVPNDWKRLLDAAAAAYEAGIPLRPQVPARPLGLLTGLQTFNAFHTRPTYLAAAARADGDLDALVAALRDPATRRAILDEPDSPDNRMPYLSRLDRTFDLGHPPRYEPDPDTSLAREAERAGRDPFEYAYDLMLTDGGRALFFRPLLGTRTSRSTRPGDADASRDCDRPRRRRRARGSHLRRVEHHVHADALGARPQSRRPDPAGDRGPEDDPRHRDDLRTRRSRRDRRGQEGRSQRDRFRTAAAAVADDGARPAGRRPAPAAGADGYRATIVSGRVVLRDGVDTGARPGALIRGSR